METNNKVDVLLGVQWGDEGKGKIVDVLTPRYDIIARFQGGPNAGHTLEFDNIKHVLHIIPSGIFHPEKINLIGNGVLVDPVILQREIAALEAKGVQPKKNLYISKKAHLILPSHRLIDAANEDTKGKQKIGSTLKGIGPAYTDKVARNGIRVGDILCGKFLEIYRHLTDTHLKLVHALGFDRFSFSIDGMDFDSYEQAWLESVSLLQQCPLVDSEYFLNQQLLEGKKILAEGAQGSMLDIDFGSYPFVTSSNTLSSGVCSGLGIAPSKIGKVYGICKAYCTRVGNGPFPTELFDKNGDTLRNKGAEFGSTTGRPRRCGWLDLPALKYSCMLNGITHLFITKMDVLNEFETFNICESYNIDGNISDQLPYALDRVKIIPQLKKIQGWKSNLQGISSYNELPEELKDYVEILEKALNIPVSIISVGPNRKDTIIKPSL